MAINIPNGPNAIPAAAIVKENVGAAIAAGLVLIPVLRELPVEKAAEMLELLTVKASTTILEELEEADILQGVR